jgi:hypothetical protein
MNKIIQNRIIVTGIIVGLAIAPAMAQSDGSSNMKMSKMPAKSTMMEIDKMSNQKKAACSTSCPTPTRMRPPEWPATI